MSETTGAIEITEDISVRAALEGKLSQYVAARSAKAIYEQHMADIASDLKAWLETNPGETLLDGEHGIAATLQEKDLPGRACDLYALWVNDQALFHQLVVNGCLRVDETAIKRAGALVGGIEPYLAPKSRGTSLQVKEIK